ncbi:MAG: transporter substrate-binding domain-containing protein [Parvibaculum sp.]
MRFLLYLNLIAIVVLAGALTRLYEGAPLPWVKKAEVAVLVAEPESRTTATRRERSPAEPPLTVEQLAALQLPLPNPDRDPIAEPEAAPPRIRILTEGDYPPFNYRTEAGALSGFDIELAQALCERMAADCAFEVRPWNELLPSLKRGEGDAVVASMLIPAPGRESPASDRNVVFTQSYYSTPGHFAARKNAVPPAATPDALSGRRIAVQAGSAHQAFALAHFSTALLLPFSSPESAQAALAEGRADLIFADRNALLRWTSGDAGICCRLVGPDYGDAAYFGEGAGIALRADDEALRSRFNEALSALVADGTYARISARYFSMSIY